MTNEATSKPGDFSMKRISALLFLIFTVGTYGFAADFPQGLILHFNFDQSEGSVITDRSGRNNNGRVTGARWTAQGKLSGGYEFISTNNYILVTNSPTLNSAQATFAVWFKTMKSDMINRYLFEKSAPNGYFLCISGNGEQGKNRGKLCFTVAGHSCLSDQTVTDNTWHHGTATFDGEHLKLYVDGQLQHQVGSWKGSLATTNDLTLGLNRSSPAPLERGISFAGTLDEAMVFNHALTEAEVKAVMTATKPKFTKEQVARRLIELKELLDRGLILQDFYDRKVKECEVSP